MLLWTSSCEKKAVINKQNQKLLDCYMYCYRYLRSIPGVILEILLSGFQKTATIRAHNSHNINKVGLTIAIYVITGL